MENDFSGQESNIALFFSSSFLIAGYSVAHMLNVAYFCVIPKGFSDD
jgi:hypothetical protein